jgi:NAD-dependent DNA ligase
LAGEKVGSKLEKAEAKGIEVQQNYQVLIQN